MREGLLYINDKPVKRERLSDFIGEDPCGSDATARVKRWKETLPNGVSYESLDCVDNGFYDNTNVYTVPPGHFFMMGDNRDNSEDSRYWGFLPREYVKGKAAFIYWSFEDSEEGQPPGGFTRFFTTIRWSRLFHQIH
jgi:signal peptidase I